MHAHTVREKNECRNKQCAEREERLRLIKMRQQGKRELRNSRIPNAVDIRPLHIKGVRSRRQIGEVRGAAAADRFPIFIKAFEAIAKDQSLRRAEVQTCVLDFDLALPRLDRDIMRERVFVPIDKQLLDRHRRRHAARSTRRGSR